MATTPNLGVTLVEQNQSQKEVTVNEGFLRLDEVVAKSVIERGSGEFFQLNRLEVDALALSGASVTTSLIIPDRALVYAVHTQVTEAITGATDFAVEDGTTAGKFGAGIGIALDSTNIGIVTPTPYFADTPIILTPNGGNFTGGAVKLVMHYVTCKGPWDF